MHGICKLRLKDPNDFTSIEYQETPTLTHGDFKPKDRETYNVVIIKDNPDITSLTTEKRLTEQACAELEKQIGYNLKIWHQFEYPYTPDKIDITVEFRDSDPYFTDNTLAYAGYPNGSLRGKVVFNNKYPWLDGYERTGAELRELGIILPNMVDTQNYSTFNYRQTFKHEGCGHIFGLVHTTDDIDVMNAYYRSDRLMFGAESKETLNGYYGHADFIKRLKPDSYIKSVMKRPLPSRYI